MSVGANRSLDRRIRLKEKASETIDDPPSDIEEQLMAAEFERKSSNVFVKRRQPYSSSSEMKVVEVRIEEDSLTLSTESIVGVVNLTPSARIQIDPKIGWSEILEMFLEVQEKNRSVEYQGVPIREFLGDELAIEDIFVVIAVNYLNSLEPVWREGLVREFKQNHYDAVSGRGRVDIQQSLLNRSNPSKSNLQRFVEKQVDYDIPVHRLLHRAGAELLKLFRLHSDHYNHEGFYRIFESVENQVRRFEDLGIESSRISIENYREVSLHDLPPTRHYYAEALETAKMIISSSTGEPMAVGEQDLTMDYILNMDDLFEKYTQLLLEEKLADIKVKENFRGPESLEVSSSQTIPVFEGEANLNYQPDHVIRQADGPIAVLDSKYYSRDKNPVRDNYARSRMFSYGFFLGVEKMAYLSPFGGRSSYALAGKDGELDIVSPEQFTTANYTNEIEDYLEGLFSEYLETIPVLEDLRKHTLLVDGVEVKSLEEIQSETKLSPDRAKSVSPTRFRQLAKSEAKGVLHSRNAEWREVSRAYKDLFTHHDGNDRAIPIFRQGSSDRPDLLQIYFLKFDDEKELTEEVICGPYQVNWKGHGNKRLEDWEGREEE